MITRKTILQYFPPKEMIRAAAKRFLNTAATRATTLTNGMRVVSIENESHFVSCGVFVDSGSRFENERTIGATHLLEKLVFKSTEKYTSEKLVEKVELLGGQFQLLAQREILMYQAMIFKKDLSDTFDVFGQIIRHPLLLPDDFEDAKQAANYELLANKWDPLQSLPEKLHAIAYPKLKRTSLDIDPLNVDAIGRSPKIPEKALESVNLSSIREFRDSFFTPERICVVGVGVDHEELVKLAVREFEDMPPASKSILQAQQDASVPSKYHGGVGILDTSSLEKSPNPDDMTLTHLQVAFESMGVNDPDIYALSTLSSLLGGGGSFSAGMYTRLYTQVLNRNGWIENCNVINHTHKDSSLFGITISVPSDVSTHKHVAHVLCDQLITCTTDCSKTELDRAKNQLKSSLLMSLESQLCRLEDVGRQVLMHGKRMEVEEMCHRIDMVTESDLIRVGRRVFLGENIDSPFQFDDGVCNPWQATGEWNPTILVEGPLTGKKDPLWDVKEIINKWGLGGTGVVKKKRFFNFR